MNNRVWRSAALAMAIVVMGLVRAAWADAPALQPGDDAVKVQKGAIDLSLNLDGVFVAKDAYQLRVKTLRRYDELVIDKSAPAYSKVSKGDTLLQLRRDKIDAQIASAQNDLKSAEANFAKAQSDVDLGKQADEVAMKTAQEAVDHAQTDLALWDKIEGKMFALAAIVNKDSADYEAEYDADELDQLHKMYKSEDLSSATADIVVKRAARTLELQKMTAAIADEQSDRTTQVDGPFKRQGLEAAARQQAIALDQLAASQTQGRILRETALTSAKLALEQARKSFDELQSDLKGFIIKSPIDGIVVYGSFDQRAWQEREAHTLAAGERIPMNDQGYPADEVLMTVYTPGNLSVKVDCPEEKVTWLSAGAKVKVTPVAMPDVSYDGTCEPTGIFGQAKGAGQAFEVSVDLPAADERLAPGFRADVFFDGGKLKDVLVVPVTAVSHGKVWVRNGDGKVEPRDVVVGKSDDENVEIKSGVEEGDMVLKQARHAGGSN